jgi:hypothetical protein
VAERAVHEARAVDTAYLAGGAALFASAFLQWVTRGPGSGLRGHDLVDTVVALGRHVPALSSGRLTILWYLVPALGAASWIAGGLRGAQSRAGRIVAGTALVVTVIVGVAFVRFVGLNKLGWGPKVAVAGALVLCIAAWWPRQLNDGRGSDPSP